jgi:hypothetical protein
MNPAVAERLADVRSLGDWVPNPGVAPRQRTLPDPVPA